jgi:hypothetical protein
MRGRLLTTCACFAILGASCMFQALYLLGHFRENVSAFYFAVMVAFGSAGPAVSCAMILWQGESYDNPPAKPSTP